METTTVSADSVIATTPAPSASAELPIEQVVADRVKNQPKIDRVDYKALADLPDDAVRTQEGIEEIRELSAAELLAQLDGKETGPIEEEKKSEKKSDSLDLDLDSLDLTGEKKVEKKGEKKSKEENLAELRKKAEAAELAAKEKDSELETYRKKAEALEAELERTAFEKSPKFKSKFEDPYKASKAAVIAFASEYEVEESVAEKALSLKGKERLEFIDENFGSGAAAARFLNLVDDADSKRSELESALLDHKKTHELLDQEAVAEVRETHEQVLKKFDAVKNHLSERSDFFKHTGDPDADKIIDSRIAAAKAIIMGEASEKDMAVAPFLAVIAKEAVQEAASLRSELAKYKSRAAEDAAVVARVNRGSMDSGDEGTKNGKPIGGLDAIRAAMRGR